MLPVGEYQIVLVFIFQNDLFLCDQVLPISIEQYAISIIRVITYGYEYMTMQKQPNQQPVGVLLTV